MLFVIAERRSERMITENDIKQTAARYAEIIIENDDEFFKLFDGDKEKFSPKECAAVIQLTNLYCNVKTGSTDRKTAVEEQKRILAQYRQYGENKI